MSLRAIKLNNLEVIRLSENLSNIIQNQTLSVNQIAQELGIPMMTLRRLLSGETTDPRISTVKLIANHFGITVDSLIENNTSLPINASKKTKPIFAPILDWETAERINSISELQLANWTSWQPVSLCEKNVISDQAFALESRPSMYPRYPQGTIFIIDPVVTPADGDVVLVKIKENNKLTLRELLIDPPEWKLYSLTADSIMLNYSTEKHHVVGVVLLTMLYNRRICD